MAEHSPTPWATMAGAPWNVLDASGVRIAWCNREDYHKPSDLEDEENAWLMANAPRFREELIRAVWQLNHLQQAIKRVIDDGGGRPEDWKPDPMTVDFLKQALSEAEDPDGGE